MLKKIGIFIGIVLFILACIQANIYEYSYNLTDCIIVESNNNVIMVQDKGGNLWEYSNSKEYKVGDIVTLKMHNNFTTYTNQDDIIKGIK